MLLAMPMLTASPEMKQAAMADEPKKETTYYGHTYTTRTYFAYMNCLVQDGILKAAFFLPDHLRLDGNNPVYEVFLDKENRQFLTYDHLEKKWRDAKLDRLEWHGRNYYATCWVSEEDAALVQDYFSGERGGALGILDFQRNVRDEQLERRHKRITDPWDQDLAQVPELPKDWAHWADKVAVRENFIFYHYKRGGAKTGYCTFCGKEVPISGHPYHNKEGRCIRCRHPVVFKALGRAGYFQTDKYYAYLVQRCRDGFVVREFRADRTYRKDTLPHSEPYLAMAERLHYDTSDEIVYRVRKLRQRHDELVLQSEAGSLEEQASKMAAKYPHVNAICVELQEKYAYSDDDYTVLAPQDIFEIIKEGRMLHHCVGNDGAGERYYDRMERRESFIMFLRRTEEPNDPYYTLEIEPDGTVRQKRTLFDRQYEDIEQATEFLIKWQKVIAARLTGRDLKLAERSRELRKEEFIQMRKDRVIIHTGHLAGRLLADVLLADLMENTEVMQPQALPAAA